MAELERFGVEARPSSQHQRGLFATSTCSSGATLLRVPTEARDELRQRTLVDGTHCQLATGLREGMACMDLDYTKGLRIFEAEWPRMRVGLAAKEAHPWDILFALALCDARAGAGDEFWCTYARALLPHAAALTHPFCQPQDALTELQHPRVADAAARQQARLANDFPNLAAPVDTGDDAGSHCATTELQWALACVRSRAFQIGDGRFAYVPFLDLANHAQARRPEPNADFRASGDRVELFALHDVAAGDEITISYTDKKGATNRRLLVQYGFVQEGNPGDRLDLGLMRDGAYIGTTPLRGSPGAALSLSRLNAAMGDSLFGAMMRGGAPMLLAAMKGLPTYDDVHTELPNQKQLLRSEAQTVGKLQVRLDEVTAEFTTSLEEDQALLADDAAGATQLTAWQRVAAQYRVERKQLARATQTILSLYQRLAEESSA